MSIVYFFNPASLKDKEIYIFWGEEPYEMTAYYKKDEKYYLFYINKSGNIAQNVLIDKDRKRISENIIRAKSLKLQISDLKKMHNINIVCIFLVYAWCNRRLNSVFINNRKKDYIRESKDKLPELERWSITENKSP